MEPKYEFTGKTKKWGGRTLHQIRRLSDGMRGGWIESKENLSQEGNCWVDGRAVVYGEAKVYGNAQVFGDAVVEGRVQIYGNAKVSGDAWVHDNAKVYSNAEVFDDAKISGNAKVYGSAHIYGSARIYGNAEIYGDEKIFHGEYTTGKFSGNENSSKNNETKKVIQDFIYKVDDSNKLTTQTEYDSIDEFFNEPVKNDIKLDTLIICAVDTKEPLIKLQKVETDNKTEFKFIVDMINEDGDNFTFKSVIKSQDQLNQLIQQTVEALKQYPKFNKYADDLEEYL